MTEDDEQPILRPGAAARRLGITTRTLARRGDAGAVTVIRVDGGHRRYLEAEIELIREKPAS